MAKTRWTRFMDMHSGGGTKEPPYEYIYIEADEETAKVIFYNRFGHNPERVTCTCCGEDYSIDSANSIEKATAYNRNCQWRDDRRRKGLGHYIEEPSDDTYRGEYKTVEEYEKSPDVLFIRIGDIKDEERIGSVPQEGYVWIEGGD